MGFLDNLMGGGQSDESQKYLEQALQQFQNIQTPTATQETIGALPQETVQGTLTPEQLQAITQGKTEMGNIALDPATRQAQMNALGQMQDIANAGGLDAESKLALQQAMSAATEQSRGQQAAIQEAAQRTGTGGSDFTLAQRAIAAQGASNAGADQGMQAAAIAEANRQQALAGMGALGGQLNSQDWQQASAKANAQDVINSQNTAAQNTAAQTNVANNMSGQQFNVGNAQNVNAANTGTNQNLAYYNASLPQQQFNNEMAKAQGMAGVNQQQASAAQQAAQRQAGFWGGLIGTAGTVAGTALAGPVGGLAAHAALQPSTAQVQGSTVGRAPNNYYQTNGGSVPFSKGGKIPGEAEVSGDSEKNDKVPILASPGEMVIPRSKANDPEKAKEFVAKEKSKLSLDAFSKRKRGGK